MRQFQQVIIADDINQERLSAIKVSQDELPDVYIVDTPVRYCTYGAMASHLIGYMNEVSRGRERNHSYGDTQKIA